jgi:hypothetical protein
VTNK